MENKYGAKRVVEPYGVLPTSAWRLDNSRKLNENEMRIAVKRVHIEGTSFKQICLEANDNEEAIRQKVTDIVIKRGKLHNPVTDTGGLLCGVVEEIGTKYVNKKDLRVGDEILCNVSLASVPMHVDSVGKIYRAFNQLDMEGYAIAHDDIPVIRKPLGLPVDLMMYIFNESGTLYQMANNVKEKETFLVLGTNSLMNLIFGYTIKKVAGEKAYIVNIIDERSTTVVKGGSVERIFKETFDETHRGNLLKPLETLEKLKIKEYDMAVNCSETPGAEPLSILATKYGGSVILANLINNYNMALYVTESMAKFVEIHSAEGYLESYDAFDMEIVGELASYFKGSTIVQEAGWTNDKREEGERANARTMSEDFVSESVKMNKILDEINTVAKYDCNVLITGETGVGKEKVANIIQKNSGRSMQPFIKVNCAAISPNLMESEFFGYEAGAFTGASTMGKKGYFEMADEGIIFLDEVGEIPLDMQAKLLRVIQDGEFYRVGGSRPIKSNVRILSATNRNLEESIYESGFRRDLYYRLNVFPINVPSLTERKEDVKPLIEYFLNSYGKKFNIKRGIEGDAVEYLINAEWKGNIRELENTIQRLLISAKEENIVLMDVIKELHGEVFEGTTAETVEEAAKDNDINMEQMVEEFERQIIKKAYEKHGSTRKAAKAIGVSQSQLMRKKKKYGV